MDAGREEFVEALCEMLHVCALPFVKVSRTLNPNHFEFTLTTPNPNEFVSTRILLKSQNLINPD